MKQELNTFITEEMPLVKIFKTPRCYYLYSTNRDCVIQISKDVYESLDQKYDTSQMGEKAINELERLWQEGMLSTSRIIQLANSTDDNTLTDILQNNINQLLLQITQSCNLTCSYCPYANITRGKFQRNHANKHMSLEVAKQAIDFLVAHSAYSNEITVSFYGGEPLIKFDLIEQIVGYAKSMSVGKKLNFTMTTNGTLMTDEIIDFLVDNSFQVLFSIDGPASIHNINRRKIDGTGSFTEAFSNFKKMMERSNGRKTGSVAINTVFDPNNDLDDVLTLFDEPILEDKAIPIYASIAEDIQLEKSIIATDSYVEKMNYQYFLGYLDFLRIVSGIKVPSFITRAIMTSEKTCSELKTASDGLPFCGVPGGPCIPGVRRLFVSIDGTLYPCEKVNELSDSMKIGHIDSGIDVAKVKRLMNIAQLTPERCKNCWALIRCQLCAKLADHNGELSGEFKNQFCYKTYNYMDDILRDFALMNECKTIYKRRRVDQ